jgi:hypothetical protein
MNRNQMNSLLKNMAGRSMADATANAWAATPPKRAPMSPASRVVWDDPELEARLATLAGVATEKGGHR